MYVTRFLTVLFVGCTLLGLVACSGPEPGAGTGTAAAPAESGAAEAPAAEPETVQVAQAPADPPEVVAEKFIEAGNSGDRETFMSLLTEKAREGFGGDAELGDDTGFDTYTIGETTIDGDTATVAVDATDDGEPVDVSLRMRQEEAQWRVFAMDIDLGDGLVMKMDLEQLGSMLDSMAESMGESMGQAMAEGFSNAFETSPEQLAAERAKYDALRAISAEEYEASWKNTIDYQGGTVEEALSALAESVGLPVDFGEHTAAVSAEVTAEVAGLSVLESIERIAGDAGLYPVFPDPQYEGGAMLESMATALTEGMTQMLEETGISIEGADLEEEAAPEAVPGALTFEAGERPLPVVFTGPFAVEIVDVEENAPNTTGTLSLAVRTYGLDSALMAMLEGDTDSTWFEAVADAQGRPLIDEDVMYLGGGTSDGVRYADSYSLDLRNLIREVETIATVAGVQRLLRPTEVVELGFTDASEGATAESNGFSGTIDTAGDYTEINVTTPEGFDADDVIALGKAEDAEGNPVNVSYVSTMAWQEGEIDVSVNLDAPPAALQIKLVTGLEAHEYPFEFAAIPLQHAAEQPEKVEELSFEGDVPVSVHFLEITEPDESFGKIRVSVINHSNKDADNVSLNLIYLDGDGNELDSFPAGLSSTYSFEDGEMVTKPAAAKGSTEKVETTAFSMPSETQNITVEVTSVDFVDGTSWSAEF